MTWHDRPEPLDERHPVNKSTLSILTLVFGWLGSHKFYAGYDLLGAFYFAVTVLGFVLTVYEPLWVSVSLFGKEFNFNLAILILIAPFVASIVEFFLLQGKSDFEVESNYPGTSDPLTLVFVSQFIFLILLILPLILRVFS